MFLSILFVSTLFERLLLIYPDGGLFWIISPEIGIYSERNSQAVGLVWERESMQTTDRHTNELGSRVASLLFSVLGGIQNVGQRRLHPTVERSGIWDIAG
jgi:hypothetical protein